MAVSTQKINQGVRDEIARQKAEREAPIREAMASQKAEREGAVVEEIGRQKRIRGGDYDATTIPGALQAIGGVGENILNMATGFAGAVPGGVRGATWAIMAPEGEKSAAYSAGFEEGAGHWTYEPKTQKGKRYQGVVQDTYNEYINEKWGGYVEGLLDEGRITPAEATYYKTSADALAILLPLKAGKWAYRAGGRAAEISRPKSNRVVDIDAEVAPRIGRDTIEGEVIPRDVLPDTPGQGALQKRLPASQRKLMAPDDVPVAVAVRQALDQGIPPEEINAALDSANAPGEVAESVTATKRGSEPVDGEAPSGSADPKDIFKNRQAGAVDLDVFAEGIAKIARPGIVTAKVAADLSHALARQIAFKHVTDIRKINSPTAQMLADRIMPLEDSTIELGGGFHELISLKEGEYNSRIEMILEPLRKQVINSNAAKSLRLIALPKRTNDAIFRGLDTGKVPEKLVPAVKALRGILNNSLEYQIEAGVKVSNRPNFMPHVWDVKKISKAEFGRKKGGDYTKYLMEEEGMSFDAAQGVISTLTHEEGFLDFVEDTGGRLQKGADYSAWSGRVMQVGGGASRPGYTQGRSLKGDFDTAKKWLVTDVESVLTSYVNRSVRHAEYTRIAGSNESILNQTVRQIIEEQQLTGHEGGKLRASSPHTTAQEIYDVFDAMQGRFNQIQTPSVRRASKAIAGFQVVQKLALVALAQFPETMMPAAKYRVATATKIAPGIPIPLKSYAVGMADSIINGLSSLSKVATGARLIPKTVMREHLERIGVIYTSSLQSSATRMAGPTGVITNRVIHGFQMETITNLQRTVALDTINSMIRENARYLAKGLAQGTKARMYRQELTELGIKPEEAIAWYREGMPQDHPISKKFDLAHVRGIKTTIIMPEAANAPRLYNDPRFQLPLIFTRFFTVFGNTVLKNLGKKLVSGDVTNTRKLASVGSLIAAVGIAYYTQFLREEISGYQYRDEDDPLRVVDAFDSAGLTAMFTRLYPLISEYKYGQGSQMVAGLLGGPFASDVAGLIEASKGSSKQKAKYLAKMTPIMTITPESEEIMYEFYLELIESMD